MCVCVSSEFRHEDPGKEGAKTKLAWKPSSKCSMSEGACLQSSGTISGWRSQSPLMPETRLGSLHVV